MLQTQNSFDPWVQEVKSFFASTADSLDRQDAYHTSIVVDDFEQGSPSDHDQNDDFLKSQNGKREQNLWFVGFFLLDTYMKP